MEKRSCGNCLYFSQALIDDSDCISEDESFGECRIRSVPCDDFPSRYARDCCGEWQDNRFTPEQRDRKDLIRRIAFALMCDPSCKSLRFPGEVWTSAVILADHEPRMKVSGEH